MTNSFGLELLFLWTVDDDGDMIIKCGVCKRWCHAECDQITTEEDAEKCAQEGTVLT